MSTTQGPDAPLGGWTIATYSIHNEALRDAEARFQAERDRRYAEVNTEKEKALKIKETADLAALQLAREIQTYKDEKANELREQINRERGLYATKDDVAALEAKLLATIAPLVQFMSATRGESQGMAQTRTLVFAIVASVVGVAGVLFGVVSLIGK